MWVLLALTAATAALARRTPTRGATPALLVPALFVSALGVAMAQTVVLAVLPVFGRQLGVSTAAATWLLTGFMLAAAVATPVAGRLGDVHGYRRVMLVSLGVLVAGSVLAAVADHAGSFAGLLLGRVVQGLSAGVFPVAFGLARRRVPASGLTGVVAGLSAMFGVGGALGMVLAGPLVGVFGTAALFWLCAALGLVALAGVAVTGKPEERARAGSLDVGGALLLSVVVSIGMFAAVTLIPQFAQMPPAAVYGLGATAAGIGCAPGGGRSQGDPALLDG